MNKKLPKDWRWVMLGKVAEITSSKRIYQHEYVSNGIPFYRTKEIKELSEGKDLTFDLFISNEKYNEIKNRFTVPKKGDVLLSAVGTIGISYIIKNDKPFYFKDGNLMWLRNLNDIDPKFLSYGLTNFIKNRKGAKTSGSAYSALTIETIKNFNFPLPTLETQQAIVSKIEELFSELDKGIEDLKTAQQQLKTYRQSVLKWAFEGKLTNENIKDGKLPKGWKYVNIEDIAKVGTGATPLKGNKSYYENGKIAWVTSGALNDEFVRSATDYVTELALKETNLSLYPKHTLLLALYGEGKTRGKCSELLIEATTNQAIAAISFENHDIRVKPFLKYFLLKNYNDIRMLSSGGVQPNLNLGIVKKTQLPFPPSDEQNQIVQEIESRLSVADKMEETIAQSLQQAEALRQSILKKAFSGELV